MWQSLRNSFELKELIDATTDNKLLLVLLFLGLRLEGDVAEPNVAARIESFYGRFKVQPQ